jgi:hypothetical protein
MWKLGEASFCIAANDGREIMRISPDGQLVINPEFTADEVARAFWEAVQKIAAEHRAEGSPQ